MKFRNIMPKPPHYIKMLIKKMDKGETLSEKQVKAINEWEDSWVSIPQITYNPENKAINE